MGALIATADLLYWGKSGFRREIAARNSFFYIEERVFLRFGERRILTPRPALFFYVRNNIKNPCLLKKKSGSFFKSFFPFFSSFFAGDHERARRYFQRAAATGHARAQCLYASMLLRGAKQRTPNTR